MINHRDDLGLKLGHKPGELGEPHVERIKAGPHGSKVRRGLTSRLLRVAPENPVQVSGLPPQRRGQGFKGAGATAALDGVPLDFPHDGHGHVRTLRKLTLTPAELADTAADSPGNGSPVLRIAFRHAFLRAPLPAPRLAGHFAIPRRAETNRKQAKAFRNIYSRNRL
jgi:hypothetical protein